MDIFSYALGKKKGGGGLPSYVDLSYIESTGIQYIDTGVVPDDTFKIEMQLQQVQKYGSYPKAFGSEIAHNDNMFKLDIGQAYAMNRFMFYYGNSDEIRIETSGYLKKHTIAIEKGKIVCDGVEQTFTATSTLNSGQNMYLFMANRNGSAIEGGALKLFYCKIWKNGALVRNFVPKFQLSDYKFGLYDTINDTFYENLGNGSFTGE